MTVDIIKDKDIWDSFIDSSPYGLLFHKWDFLKITEKHTGFSLIPLGMYQGDDLVCVCPLFQRHMHGLHLLLSPPPMQGVIPYLGFVMSDLYDRARQREREEMLSVVGDDLNEEITRIAPNYSEIRLVPGFKDLREFVWKNYDARIYYTYTIDLLHRGEEIWATLTRKLRAILRRTESAGYHLERESDLGPFYRVVAERFSHPSKRVPLISRSYFEDLFSAYPGQLGLYYLYARDGELAGAVTTQEYKDRFLYWVGSPKIDQNYGNEYLQWLLIQRAESEGFALFENIGANNPALNQFKSKFNPNVQFYLEISRRDVLGRLASMAYSVASNRSWLKRRLLPHIE